MFRVLIELVPDLDKAGSHRNWVCWLLADSIYQGLLLTGQKVCSSPVEYL